LSVGRHEHAAIDDKEVGVAGREVTFREADRLGQGQLDDLEAAAVAKSRFAEPSEILRQGKMVGRCAVVLGNGNKRAWCDEAREVVDMAVGIIIS
jgi:hypothetical protein